MTKNTSDRPTALALLREATTSAATSTFEAPRKVPGERVACLSPLEALSLMRVERPGVDVNDLDLWLSEADVETVHTDGVEFGGETYWHEDLAWLTSGDKRAPRRDYFIRYDRALFARGILKEVHLYERTRKGSDFRCTCVLRPEALSRLPEADRDRLLQKRAHYERNLKHRRDLSERQLIALESDHAVLDRHLRDLEARRKRQRSTRRKPIVSEPIIELTPAEQELARKQKAEERKGAGARRTRSNKKDPGTADPPAERDDADERDLAESTRSVPDVFDILSGSVGVEQEE